jgi:hypothetical protein
VLAAVVAATVLLLLGATTTTPPAYALVRHPDGSVTVTVHNLQRAIMPLNARLGALGVRVRIIPITKRCSIVGPVFPIRPSRLTNFPYTFTAQKPHLADDDWGFIAVGHSDAGQLLYAQGAMVLPLPPCLQRRPHLRRQGRRRTRQPRLAQAAITPAVAAPVPGCRRVRRAIGVAPGSLEPVLELGGVSAWRWIIRTG